MWYGQLTVRNRGGGGPGPIWRRPPIWRGRIDSELSFDPPQIATHMKVDSPMRIIRNPGLRGPIRARGKLPGHVTPQPTRLVAILLLVVVVAVGAASSAQAQVVDSTMWTTNGEIRALAKGPGTIYVGGTFDLAGPATGGGTPIEAGTGTLPAGFPKVMGYVHAVIPDGAGGWYIGGDFTSVGGLPRQALARVNGDLTVSPWHPWPNPANPTPVVWALAADNSYVYAGGSFTSIGSVYSPNLAKVDASTGATISWGGWSDGPVRCLLLNSSLLYVGGSFSNIAGRLRPHLCVLDAGTGSTTGWVWAGANNDVLSITLSGSSLYVGGLFTSAGGQPRNYVAELDATSGAARSWAPSVGGGSPTAVTSLATDGTAVYIGGSFSSVNGTPTNCLAAVSTGGTRLWGANATAQVDGLCLNGSTLYAGGLFRSIGGQSRNHVAALNTATGLATTWNPSSGGRVQALAASGSRVYAGGEFTTMNAVTRNSIAAFDSTTGVVTNWNPGGVSSWVYAMAVRDSTLFVGGNFTSMGGQARRNLAALNTRTGLATSLSTSFSSNSLVKALALSGSTLYFGGGFTTVGGQTRNNAAAVNVDTGVPTAWNPDIPDGQVNAVQVSNGQVYLGGDFTTAGGVARSRLANVDATTGVLGTWNPSAGGSYPVVYALTIADHSIYIGGSFSDVGGVPRVGLAKVDDASGVVDAWNAGEPNYSSYTSIAVDGLVYACGGWRGARAFSPTSGVGTGWSVPVATLRGLSYWLGPIMADGSSILVAGNILGMGSQPCGPLARISAPTYVAAAPHTEPDFSSTLRAWPNPFTSQVSLSFSLPTPTMLRMDVMDVMGRRVWTSGEREFSEGEQTVSWVPRAQGHAVGAGMYFVRLRGGDVDLTRSVLLIR